ncbi:hypothetical protein AK830_g8418 [Neonectria ditissima]|uniref:Zn(2)-C6 fungal-type domain-containing protein n=1 Tax=Neonectria ditissima TaxID=78410 RepID=A0A0P7BEA8_9HYPO|nr:hypothetical protein AK830_g8418 [Neonectria ditissima]
MPRSRGGCTNCKRRKRKCDEQRPGCQACARRSIQCEGYATALRWTGGIATRGRFAGVSVPDVAACARAAEAGKKSLGKRLQESVASASAVSTSAPTSAASLGRPSPSSPYSIPSVPSLHSAHYSSAVWTGSVSSPSDLSSFKGHIEWRRTLHEVRMSFLRRDSFKLVKATFELLDDAWQDGTSDFDIHQAARSKGMEIAVF